jgi:hypothetical protein
LVVIVGSFHELPVGEGGSGATSDRSRAGKARCSVFQVSISLVITGPDSPVVEPRN